MHITHDHASYKWKGQSTIWKDTEALHDPHSDKSHGAVVVPALSDEGEVEWSEMRGLASHSCKG